MAGHDQLCPAVRGIAGGHGVLGQARVITGSTAALVPSKPNLFAMFLFPFTLWTDLGYVNILFH